MAYPIFPEERLLRKRTGSISSRVGPAVTTNFTRSIDRAGAEEIRREKQCLPPSKGGRCLRNRRRACLLRDQRSRRHAILVSPHFPASRRSPTFFRSWPVPAESARVLPAQWRRADDRPDHVR